MAIARRYGIMREGGGVAYVVLNCAAIEVERVGFHGNAIVIIAIR